VIDRLPPHSLEAEQSVLGAILIDRETIIEIAEFLHPEDFYRQAHGTIFLGIGVAVVVLMLGALLAVRGIGPFQAQVVAFQPDGDGLRVSLAVKNEGTSLGSTTCRISDPTSAAGMAAIVQSPRIQPGATLTFDATVTGLGPSPKQLIAECSSP